MTAQTFQLAAKTRRHQIADYLRDEITSGRLPPGSPLREVELSGRLGVSRGPLREALRDLEQDGLVNVKAYSGTTVAQFSAAEFIEIYQVRSAIEKKAFQLLWDNRNDEYRQEIQARHEKLLTAINDQDVYAIISAEMNFHTYPYEFSGNKLLNAMWVQLARKIRITVMLHRDAFSAVQNYELAHLSYLEAAMGDDLEKMAEEVDRHLYLGEELLSKFYPEKP